MRNTIWIKRLRLLVTTTAISFLVILGGHLDASDFEYDIDDTRPAGGYIFYVDEADEYDWTYLEVSPVDVLVGGENPHWGAIDVTVAVPGSPYSDERDKLGSGQDNTLEIVRFFDSLKHEDTGEDYYSFAWNDQPQDD